MKQTKITSGQREVYLRAQFQVKTGLRLRDLWLEEELHNRLVSSHPFTNVTIEVKGKSTLQFKSPAGTVFIYCITYAPSVIGHSHRTETLTTDEILEALKEIENSVKAAMRSRHLLSGLVEDLEQAQVEKTARPEPSPPGRVM